MKIWLGLAYDKANDTLQVLFGGTDYYNVLDFVHEHCGSSPWKVFNITRLDSSVWQQVFDWFVGFGLNDKLAKENVLTVIKEINKELQKGVKDAN